MVMDGVMKSVRISDVFIRAAVGQCIGSRLVLREKSAQNQRKYLKHTYV
jgi:hypothetical protein